ncbi:MAG: hypothetical protein ACKPEO_08845 [Sphaerospermopsis kisseleviana]|uniref:Uncharacterized protein n=2 Tax=Sphaerospermopsis TaxID=752201 RepID=A0A479ZYH4_9CYAN|nr:MULTISPECIES: hypothetical protein [Sphaerospermopsis]MBD2134693.1 hypothetical protein [Sphaerospermopsis sp. FACHB-1094]MBD2144829.1 hypothetical protein [Sphaerospermopsis sp. FACHB-1194]MBE9239032.1 hypothetical protein [Sphaerospermopsis aphanizomenoides LEGE 00250]GCL37840.1 hypothetical protein SR1949_29520 [Sphaerospermopsis reniformis]
MGSEDGKTATAAAQEEFFYPLMFIPPCPRSLPCSGSCPGSACANS